MKKYILLLSAAVMFTFTACDKDYLDTAPEDSVTPDVVLSSSDYATLLINACGKTMTKQYLSSQGFNGEGTIKTWYGNYPGNDFQKCALTGWASIINGTYHERASSSYDYYPWFYYYKIIVNANTVLDAIDILLETEADPKNAQFIKAQALTYRAYSYMMLVQLYSKRWCDSGNGSSRGVVLRTSTLDIDAKPCSTLGEVYNQIYEDLDNAIQLYQACGKDRGKDEVWAPNINVAYATYARAALNKEDWSTAAKYAPLARKGYPLMSNDDYLEGGFSKPNQEWIWGCYGAEDETLYYYSFFAYQGSNSSASICRSYACAISKDLYVQIPETDVRRALWLDVEGEEFDKATGEITTKNNKELYNAVRNEFVTNGKLYSTSKVFAYMQWKFQCFAQPGVGYLNNFRSAEMYLTEAEALCHLNNDAQAAALLNELNAPRNPEYNCTKTGADLLTEVKLYRRIELWGEGFDWFDYKRWNEPIVRRSIAEGGSFHAQFAKTIAPSAENNWVWVIPNKETDYSDDLITNLE